MDVRFGALAAAEQVYLGGDDVTAALRTESAGDAASQVAVVPEVRSGAAAAPARFRAASGPGRGRPRHGHRGFPGAALKVFLTASAEERAMRRHKQLKEKGIDVSLPDLSWDIAQRDARDASRTVAPLQPAADARVIDSTSLTPEEVVARILKWLEACGRRAGPSLRVRSGRMPCVLHINPPEQDA